MAARLYSHRLLSTTGTSSDSRWSPRRPQERVSSRRKVAESDADVQYAIGAGRQTHRQKCSISGKHWPMALPILSRLHNGCAGSLGTSLFRRPPAATAVCHRSTLRARSPRPDVLVVAGRLLLTDYCRELLAVGRSPP